MTADFHDAAERHRVDADALFNNQRFANADHLFGLAAECALKTVMKGLGMQIKLDGSPSTQSHRVHVNKLWNEYISFANNRNGAKYVAGMDYQNPFSNWDVNQRYEHHSGFTDSLVDEHRKATEIIMTILKGAFLDGVI